MYNPQEKSSRFWRRVNSVHRLSNVNNIAEDEASITNSRENSRKSTDWANIGLFIIGMLGVFIATWQGCSTERALNYQIHVNKADSVSDTDKYKRDTALFNAQIRALQAAEDQFSRQNDNFLEINEVIIDFSNTVIDPILIYNLSNYGGIVRIEKARSNFGYAPLTDSIYIKKRVEAEIPLGKHRKLDSYLAQNNPKAISTDMKVDLASFKLVLKGPFIIFIAGEVFYVSLVNKKRMKMSYMVFTRDINKVSYEVLYIKNEKLN